MLDPIRDWIDLAVTGWRRERHIRRALRALARQRVLMVLQPQNFWVIEQAPDDRDEQLLAALRTCHLRGWSEVLQAAVPNVWLTPEGQLPPSFLETRETKPIYRLTEAGWAQLRRTHEWLIATFTVSLLGAAAAVMAVVLAMP